MAADVTIAFTSVDGNRAWAQVSDEAGQVRLVVSLETDGDYDVLLDPSTAEQLAAALTTAARRNG